MGSTMLLEFAPTPLQASPPHQGIETEALFREARRRRRRRRLFAAIAVVVLLVALVVIGGRILSGRALATANAKPPVNSVGSGQVRFFTEQAASMEPTLFPGDRISAINRSSPLQRGDVVVLDPPSSAYQGSSPGPEIKRIVGLPGETISSSDNTVFINGRSLTEPYLTSGAVLTAPIVTQVIPVGQYFVLGDNRADSADSRFFGPIPSASVVGIATTIVSPPSRAGPIAGE
jgi:signal peptidase I